MSFPLAPTEFASNPYEEEWYARDFFHSPDGIKEFPKHHCKLTYLVSKPFISGYGTALDVGCRDGEYARYLQHDFEHTYCFDARKRKTFPFNVDLKKTTHFNCAIGDETTTITMYGGTHNPGHSKPYEIACYPLDDFGFENVNYIKIDVEGFETKVLMGAQKLIARDKPLIVIEQNDVQLAGEAPFAAKTWLEAHDYLHVATCPRGWDFIMQHKDG